eukprot:TRINITY_DN718_c0_g1_i3.p1 TRINITY_DN718_c0_g1~~TRINITY_DN718_c0_g1_i3.p1  ORF type:complete len:102 (-),score=22.73 TRINITY_DN718_c0_g1_i3:398-703(-)
MERKRQQQISGESCWGHEEDAKAKKIDSRLTQLHNQKKANRLDASTPTERTHNFIDTTSPFLAPSESERTCCSKNKTHGNESQEEHDGTQITTTTTTFYSI